LNLPSLLMALAADAYLAEGQLRRLEPTQNNNNNNNNKLTKHSIYRNSNAIFTLWPSIFVGYLRPYEWPWKHSVKWQDKWRLMNWKESGRRRSRLHFVSYNGPLPGEPELHNNKTGNDRRT